jgi:hypothetical protein
LNSFLAFFQLFVTAFEIPTPLIERLLSFSEVLLSCSYCLQLGCDFLFSFDASVCTLLEVGLPVLDVSLLLRGILLSPSNLFQIHSARMNLRPCLLLLLPLHELRCWIRIPAHTGGPLLEQAIRSIIERAGLRIPAGERCNKRALALLTISCVQETVFGRSRAEPVSTRSFTLKHTPPNHLD